MGIGAGTGVAAAAVPPQGIFESCPLNTEWTTCLARLQTIHDAGFKVVVFPASGASLFALYMYSQAAASRGMSVMWELSDQAWWQQLSAGTGGASDFPAFAGACGCSANSDVLAYMVKWLAALPSTYGYYAVDDSLLPSASPTGVASYVNVLRMLDPQHPTMIGVADADQANTYSPVADLGAAEIYPVTTSSLLPVAQNTRMWNDVAQTASDTQALANSDHHASAFILQAFSWGDNLPDGQTVGACSPSDSQSTCWSRLRYPSSGEQLQLRNEVIAHAHPRLILWWSFPGTYGQAGQDTFTTYPTGSVAAAQWHGLVSAVRAPAPAADISTSTLQIQVGGTSAKVQKASRHRRRRPRRRRIKHRAA